MGYKRNYTESANYEIYYHFCCEYCGKDSGQRTALISEERTNSKYGAFSVPTPTANERARLKARADRGLIRTIHLIKRETSNGIYNHPYFGGICPHCYKSQSWNGGSYSNFVVGPAIAFTWLSLCLAGILFLCLIYSSKRSLTYELLSFGQDSINKIACLILSLSLSVITFIATFIRYHKKWLRLKEDSKYVVEKKYPEIDWNGFDFDSYS